LSGTLFGPQRERESGGFVEEKKKFLEAAEFFNYEFIDPWSGGSRFL